MGFGFGLEMGVQGLGLEGLGSGRKVQDLRFGCRVGFRA